MKSYNMSSEDDKAWDDPVAVEEQRTLMEVTGRSNVIAGRAVALVRSNAEMASMANSH